MHLDPFNPWGISFRYTIRCLTPQDKMLNGSRQDGLRTEKALRWKGGLIRF